MKEFFEKLCLYSICIDFPRDWELIIKNRHINFNEGEVNLLGTDILIGIIWRKINDSSMTLEKYEEIILKNLRKKSKDLKIIKRDFIEICGHKGILERIEMKSFGIIKKKRKIDHTHLLLRDNDKRFIILYLSTLPELREKYSNIIQKMLSSIEIKS